MARDPPAQALGLEVEQRRLVEDAGDGLQARELRRVREPYDVAKGEPLLERDEHRRAHLDLPRELGGDLVGERPVQVADGAVDYHFGVTVLLGRGYHLRADYSAGR